MLDDDLRGVIVNKHAEEAAFLVATCLSLPENNQSLEFSHYHHTCGLNHRWLPGGIRNLLSNSGRILEKKLLVAKMFVIHKLPWYSNLHVYSLLDLEIVNTDIIGIW